MFSAIKVFDTRYYIEINPRKYYRSRSAGGTAPRTSGSQLRGGLGGGGSGKVGGPGIGNHAG